MCVSVQPDIEFYLIETLHDNNSDITEFPKLIYEIYLLFYENKSS